VPLLILKKAIENNRYGGYSLYKNKWSFTGENCGAISMGAFFISREELEGRFTISTMQNFSTINLEMFSKRNLMNDDDCLSLEPVNGVLLEKDTPFIDIGIRSSFLKAQKFIPNII
jgi:D-glycero-alpha-D-manno-heptose 1-phosphate guanylyltransferase